MPRPPNSAIVDTKTGIVTPEWLSYLSRISGEGGGGGITIIRPPDGGDGGGGSGGGPVSFSLDASQLTGTTLAPNVITSSLTSVGILTSGALGPGFVIDFNSVSVLGQMPWSALPTGSGTWAAGHVSVTGIVSAQAFAGDGSGLTNLPLALHAVTHQAGGADAIKLDALALPDDIVALNASTTRHGLLPKLSGVATQFLNGVGAWANPPAGGSGLAAHAATHMPGGNDVLTLASSARVLGRVTNGAGPIEELTYIDLPETTPGNPPANVGRFHVTDVNGFTAFAVQDSTGLDLCLTRDNVTVAKVIGQAVTRGQVVYVSGASGANTEVQLALADSLTTLPAIGVTLDTGAVNAFVRILMSGKIAQVDTSLFPEGSPVFVSAVTAGTVTVTPPPYPYYVQRVGVVTRSHQTQGEILVIVGTTGRAQHAATHETGGSDPITQLAATVITTGILANARLSPDVLRVTGGYTGNTGVFLRGDGTWAIPSGGAGTGPHHATHEPGGSDPIAALDASVLTTGTVADARLSANIPRLNANNIYTGLNRIDNKAWLFYETAQPVDARNWSLGPNGGTFYLSPVTDAGAGQGAYVAITRQGILEASNNIRALQDVYAVNGAFYGNGIGLTSLKAQNLIQGPMPFSVVQVSASKVLGRGDSGAGAMQEITLGFGLAMTGTTLSVTSGGGSLTAHHTTHEPGGTDQLVGVAWTALANVFTATQRFDSGVRLYSSAAPVDQRLWTIEARPDGFLRLHPLTDAGADKPTAYVSIGPTGDLQTSQNFFAVNVNLTQRLQWGTTVTDPMVKRSGAGLEVRLGDDSALTTLRAKLDGGDLVSGLIPDARLSVNVLKSTGGYPGGTTNFLRADGTWTAPPGGSGGGTGADEVWIGPADPGTATGFELWYDTDEASASGVAAHHATHEKGGSDLISVLANLTVDTLTAAGLGGTPLNATSLTTGTIPDARFPATLPAVSGANLTTLNATNLTTGTVTDARLSANVALLNAATNTFAGTLRAAIMEVKFSSSTASGRLMQPVADNTVLAHNILWNGTQWNRDNTTLPAIMVNFYTSGFSVYSAPAGANPAPLVETFRSDLTGRIFERGRPFAMGEWSDVPFLATNFTADSGATWAVTAGQVNSNRYTVIGKTLIWSFYISASTLTGAPGALMVRIPYGVAVPLTGFSSVGYCVAGGGEVRARCSSSGDGATISIYINPYQAWPAGNIAMQLTIPVALQ